MSTSNTRSSVTKRIRVAGTVEKPRRPVVLEVMVGSDALLLTLRDGHLALKLALRFRCRLLMEISFMSLSMVKFSVDARL